MSFRDDLAYDMANTFINADEFAVAGGTFTPAGAAEETDIDYVPEELFFSIENAREEKRFRLDAEDVTTEPAPGDKFTEADGTVWAIVQVRELEGEYQLTCTSQNVRQ